MRPLHEDSFESGFFPWQGTSELEVPYSWMPLWDQGTEAETSEGFLVRPEYKPKWRGNGATEIRTGDWAASIHVREATHKGVLVRQFEAEPGKIHRPSVWCMGVDDPAGKSGHGMRIGIDPTGQLDFQSARVVWSDWYSQYMDEWQDRQWWRLLVDVEALNDRITVFLWSSNDYRESAFTHFDDFLLEVEGDAEQPEPEPSDDAIVWQLERIANAVEDIAAQKERGLFARLFR